MKWSIYLGISVLIFLSGCATLNTWNFWWTTTSNKTPETVWISQEERVRLAKNRRAYIDEIRKADYFALRNESSEALNEYISLLEKLENDSTLFRKIANVYYESKKWSEAYTYYSKVDYVKDLSDTEKSQMLESLIFDETITDTRAIIENLPLSQEQLDYYKTIDTCHTGIHNCIITVLAYSGTGQNLSDLKQIAQTYSSISPDFHYRNMLVATKLFEQKSYRASAKITEEILKIRPDYREAKKILGFSYLKLWKYEIARDTLTNYLEDIPKDLDTIAALGEIYFALGDYTVSNLYLNNALIAWYLPKIHLERRLAYNYMMLADVESMLKVMNYLLQRPEAKEDDYVIGSSMALVMWEWVRSYAWASRGLKDFPESSLLLTERARAYRFLQKYTEARNDINSALQIAPLNSRAQIEDAILLYYEWDPATAEVKLQSLKASVLSDTMLDDIRLYLSYIEKDRTSATGEILTQ